MESKMIGLVVVEHPGSNKRYLFIAPPYEVAVGDDVICDTRAGEGPGKVVASVEALDGDSVYKFAVAILGATEPLRKIIAVTKRRDLVWPTPPKKRTNRDVVIELLQKKGQLVPYDPSNEWIKTVLCGLNKTCDTCPLPNSHNGHLYCNAAQTEKWLNEEAQEEITDADIPF